MSGERRALIGVGRRRRPVAGAVGLAALAAAATAVVAVLATAAGAATPLEAPAPAAPTPVITAAAQPDQGPVGTVVEVAGSVPPQCQGTLTVTFGPAAGGGRLDTVQTSTLTLGEWIVGFTVPPYAGGPGTGGDVTAGPWTFEVAHPGCVPASASFTVTGPRPVTSAFAGMAASSGGGGYWLVQGTGGVYAFGDAPFLGSLPGLGVVPAAPVVAVAATPDGHGYWLADAGGGVYAFGDAGFFGSLPAIGVRPAAPVVGLAATADGGGYWLVGADGGVYAFGDARFVGAAPGGGPAGATALLPAPTGAGYLVTYAQPGVAAAFGADQAPAGAAPTAADALVTGAAAAPGGGLWEVGSDGGLFAYGPAPFLGSLPGLGVVPSGPVTGLAATPDGGGYWMVSAAGGVYAYGDAGFFGSAA